MSDNRVNSGQGTADNEEGLILADDNLAGFGGFLGLPNSWTGSRWGKMSAKSFVDSGTTVKDTAHVFHMNILASIRPFLLQLGEVGF